MDDVWVVSLCLILLVIVAALISSRKKPDEEKSKEKEVSPPHSILSSSAQGGKHLEISDEQLDAYLSRLTAVVYSSGPGRAPEQHVAPRAPTYAAPAEDIWQRSRPAPQVKPTQPSDIENILSEIEQAVQETVDSEIVQLRRRREVPGIRGHTEIRTEILTHHDYTGDTHSMPPS